MRNVSIQSELHGHPTSIANIGPCAVVIRIFPVSKAGECLHNLDPFPCLGEGEDGEFVSKLLALLEYLRAPEATADHKESRKEEWAS